MATLTKTDQQYIDGVIEDLRQKLGFSYPQDNLLDLAKKAGVKVYEDDLSAIDPNLSGALLYDDPKKKTNPRVFIHSKMPKERKQFTLAHELGHHFLQEGNKLRLDKLDYSNKSKNTREESEANYFAASLLVPKKLLLKRLEEKDDKQKLADYFKVSVPVIENRLMWIKTN